MPTFQLRKTWGAGLAIVALGLPFSVLAAQSDDTLSSTMQVQAQINNDASQSQQRVDQLSKQTQEMLEDYSQTMLQTDRLKVYNDQLEKLIASQEEEKSSIKQQLQDVGVVEKEIVPLMLRMIDSLEKFVKLDMPFQQQDRLDRVERLKKLMDDADVTISEKYRQIMDAWKQEVDYGRTMEAYRGMLKIDGSDRQVDFLRVGRVLLAYQTLDRSVTGFWNKNTQKWEKLDSDYRDPIANGLRIARKQSAPDLLTLPVPAPESAK